MNQPRIKSSTIKPKPSETPSRTQLLQAALHLIGVQGYSATSVDQICQRAGVTKGSFFHHFTSKDDLALEAVAYWEQEMTALYAAANYNQATDPLDRLHGYLDLRAAHLSGELADSTCPMGALVQECYSTHAEIRVACERAMSAHAAVLARDVAAAKRLYAPHARWNAESIVNFIEAALQGAFVLAKAKQSPEVVRDDIKHLSRYLRLLFHSASNFTDVSALEFSAVQSSKPEEEAAEDSAPLQSHFVD